MAFRCTLNPRLFAAFSLVAAVALVGCGDDDSTTTADAGDSADAGGGDAGGTDAGGADSGSDAGADTAGRDAGTDGGADVETDTGADAGTDAGGDVEQGPLAVLGEWDTDVDTTYPGFVRITETSVSFSWYDEGDVTITRYDNAEAFLVGQNAADDPFNPDKWSRFDWAPRDEGGYYWCQTVFAADTEEDAATAEPADAGDVATGCGGFPWSVITEGQGPIAIAGAWFDGFTTHTIDSDVWVQAFGPESSATYAIVSFDNARGVAIAQNDEGNDVAGGLWSRFDFAFIDGRRWYCTTTYDSATREDAEAAAAADASDPANGGCATFPWSPLDPVEAGE